MIDHALALVRQFPEYWAAVVAAVSILAFGIPVYLGLRFFIWRRRLLASLLLDVTFGGVFACFALLAFVQSSPLASRFPGWSISTFLGLTCVIAAASIVMLIDVFLLQHYLASVKRIYISPPLRSGIKLVVFCLALLPILRYVLHFNPLALVAIPTVLTAGLALALQDTFKSFIAGIGLGNIVRIGDWVSCNGTDGQVVNINLGRTVLRTMEGNLLFIPNSQLQSGAFIRYQAAPPPKLITFRIGASMDVPPEKVKAILRNCAETYPGIAREPAPVCFLKEYGESSIQYALLVWVDDLAQKLAVQDGIGSRIWYAFQRENLDMPYPVRTVRLERGRRSGDTQIKAEQALQRWKLADAFYAEELQELSRYTCSHLFAPGEVIVRRGDEGHSVYTVVDGQVEVLDPRNDRTVVTALGESEIFGEMSVLTGAPRSATVRAKGPVEILEVDKQGLLHIMAKRPELSDKLAALVTRRQEALEQLGQKAEEKIPDTSAESEKKLARKIREFFGLT